MTPKVPATDAKIALPADLPRLAIRRAESHKGDYGRVLLVGGSVGMSGAVSLAAMAALRSGAGLVSLMVPTACVSVVASFNPCYMCHPFEFAASGELTPSSQEHLDALAAQSSCVGVGPGLGRSRAAERLAIQLFRRLPVVGVVDADGLNALSTRPRPLAGAEGPRIVTPHPGEFARLVGGEKQPREQQERQARDLASASGCVMVLKGHRTFVTDGVRQYRNRTGNPGMATGGTGDVLTGVLAALVAQGLQPWDAARLAVFVHGLAGDLAAARLGQISLTAADLIDSLPRAFSYCSDESGGTIQG